MYLETLAVFVFAELLVIPPRFSRGLVFEADGCTVKRDLDENERHWNSAVSESRRTIDLQQLIEQEQNSLCMFSLLQNEKQNPFNCFFQQFFQTRKRRQHSTMAPNQRFPNALLYQKKTKLSRKNLRSYSSQMKTSNLAIAALNGRKFWIAPPPLRISSGRSPEWHTNSPSSSTIFKNWPSCSWKSTTTFWSPLTLPLEKPLLLSMQLPCHSNI